VLTLFSTIPERRFRVYRLGTVHAEKNAENGHIEVPGKDFGISPSSSFGLSVHVVQDNAPGSFDKKDIMRRGQVFVDLVEVFQIDLNMLDFRCRPRGHGRLEGIGVDESEIILTARCFFK
jgi:hypothetical protein